MTVRIFQPIKFGAKARPRTFRVENESTRRADSHLTGGCYQNLNTKRSRKSYFEKTVN